MERERAKLAAEQVAGTGAAAGTGSSASGTRVPEEEKEAGQERGDWGAKH